MNFQPKLPGTPRPEPPQRPTNALHTAGQAIGAVASLPAQGIDLLNTGFATATQSIAQVFPSLPAATMGSMALGAPHAHPAHPPSGPPPVPPTPIPPTGPIMFGCSVQVLINGQPAARAGDLGLNPTCCGLPPIFEVFTGSSNVFIGGGRAARMTDMTYHCKPVPPAGAAARGARAALQSAMKGAMVGMMAAGMAAQALNIAGDAVEAVEADSSAMSAALGLNASMMAAQMAADAVAMAMGAAMGKDPCVPPGTPGAILMGSPNVMIGGFPMPSWMEIAKGLVKVVKGLRRRTQARRGRSNCGC